MQKAASISTMLSPGDVGTIAKKLGLSVGAASAAIKRGKAGHPAVREALRMAKESGALEAAQTIATLTPAA